MCQVFYICIVNNQIIFFMINNDRIETSISKWDGASKKELKDRLKNLMKKPKTSATQAEIKAIQALLS